MCDKVIPSHKNSVSFLFLDSHQGQWEEDMQGLLQSSAVGRRWMVPCKHNQPCKAPRGAWEAALSHPAGETHII